MTRPDAELLVRFQQGDLGAFDEISARFGRRLVGYFQSLCGDSQLSEDYAQEVFVRIFRARERYSPDAALSTFIFRIAKNYWIDVYRARRARPATMSLDQGRADGQDDEGESMANAVPSGEAGPAATVIEAEDKVRLRTAMEKLPEIQRAVLVLAGGQCMKYEQIADVLGIPVGTVKSRVHAAVQNLRRLMGVGDDSLSNGSSRGKGTS